MPPTGRPPPRSRAAAIAASAPGMRSTSASDGIGRGPAREEFEDDTNGGFSDRTVDADIRDDAPDEFVHGYEPLSALPAGWPCILTTDARQHSVGATSPMFLYVRSLRVREQM